MTKNEFLGEGFNLNDFMDFKFFITPQIIKAMWIFVSLVVSACWICIMVDKNGGLGALLSIVLGLPLVLLIVRLIFESFMVMFSVITLLREIRDKQRPSI